MIEQAAADADVESRRHGASEEQRAGLEFVIQRTDEAAKLRDRIRKLQLIEEPGGMPREDAVGAAGDGLQEGRGGGAQRGEMGQERTADGGVRIVEQT